jgi:photosystem II stability/assembly factor-like uncharacterized protein
MSLSLTVQLRPSPRSTEPPIRSSRSLCPVLCLLAVALAPVRAPAGPDRWTSAGPDSAGVTSVASNPHAHGMVFAGTAGSGVFKSSDGGASWHSASAGIGAIHIEQVVAHPLIQDRVYATSPNHGVFVSDDAGDTWRAVNDGLPSPAAHHLAADPVSDTVYVSSDAGVYVSHDAGAHWAPTALRTKGARRPGDDIGLFAWVDCLVVEPFSGAVYACYFSWSQPGPGWQLLRSDDAGVTWREVPLPSGGGPVAMVAQYLWRRTELYVATYDPFDLSARVLRSFDNGASWDLVGGELPNCDGGCRLRGLAVRGYTVFAAGDHGVLMSPAGGAWAPLPDGMDDRAAVAIAADIGDGVLAYAATDDGVFSLRRTPDCGGDCDGDGKVDVAELVRLVEIAVGRGAAITCQKGDANADGQIAVDDVVAAVARAMQGCDGSL